MSMSKVGDFFFVPENVRHIWKKGKAKIFDVFNWFAWLWEEAVAKFMPRQKKTENRDMAWYCVVVVCADDELDIQKSMTVFGIIFD